MAGVCPHPARRRVPVVGADPALARIPQPPPALAPAHRARRDHGGLLSGIFAVIFGWFLAWGGSLQASASVVFGAWFLFALITAYRAIRRRDIRTHRRWMIRAFAVGLAVGTIRLWIGLFEGFDVLGFRDAFGVAFWLSFLLHAAAAELYLRWRPAATGFASVRA